ncbi:MAG: tRNA (adenosine(37)-N6)-threonylcarbamoyltransferase complex ATPase subunit type 1 TsaE [Dehalococcoidia bacterium]|nr:tRNA (adenosine(37)-N6)-threonylcarbamoyltransferase complex ATPase subunit type 1 TsaE [Dehalococcoidia bacterium]MSQ16090.1 tRNA (adenosine(37)-N6)-threonylcarbamoyltransferase complex ATPase subunit type 1 TsaE [Dehalococcoidia bacterium]
MTPALTIYSCSPEETQTVGRVLGQQAQAGDIFLLTGPLGAGKTCLTQGIAWGLGVTGYTRSPTFVIMTRHQGRLTLYHLDLYRISDPLEAWDLGLDEALFGDGVCVVEWASRASDLFPPEALWVSLDYAEDEDRRSLSFSAGAADRHRTLLADLARRFPVAPKAVTP